MGGLGRPRAPVAPPPAPGLPPRSDAAYGQGPSAALRGGAAGGATLLPPALPWAPPPGPPALVPPRAVAGRPPPVPAPAPRQTPQPPSQTSPPQRPRAQAVAGHARRARETPPSPASACPVWRAARPLSGAPRGGRLLPPRRAPAGSGQGAGAVLTLPRRSAWAWPYGPPAAANAPQRAGGPARNRRRSRGQGPGGAAGPGAAGARASALPPSPAGGPPAWAGGSARTAGTPHAARAPRHPRGRPSHASATPARTGPVHAGAPWPPALALGGGVRQAVAFRPLAHHGAGVDGAPARGEDLRAAAPRRRAEPPPGALAPREPPDCRPTGAVVGPHGRAPGSAMPRTPPAWGAVVGGGPRPARRRGLRASGAHGAAVQHHGRRWARGGGAPGTGAVWAPAVTGGVRSLGTSRPSTERRKPARWGRVAKSAAKAGAEASRGPGAGGTGKR